MSKPVIDAGYCGYINGEWIKGGEEIVSTSPADQRDQVAVFGEATPQQVREAADSARRAQKEWAETPAPVRAGIIQNFGQLIARNKRAWSEVMTREMGKPIKEAEGEVQEAIDTAEFFVSEGRRLYGQTVPSEMPNKELYTYRRPLGVFGCMTACNFPVAVPSWYFIPALVAGNTCVWKPSEDTPLTAYYFVELLRRSGLPAGVFNLVMGKGPTTGSAMIDLVDEGCFDKIGFTGSTEVGKRIGEVCGRNLQNPCLELGGKNPMIVCEDSNLDLALDGAFFSGFGTGGQRCTSLGNLILHEKIHDEFVSKLIERTKSLPIGNPMNRDNVYGPLISEKFLNNHLSHLSELVEKHHEMPLGKGGRIGHGVDWEHFDGDAQNGFYARPNIALGVKPEDRIYSTETFGPLFNVLKYKDMDEAMYMANHHGYGLSSAIYTNNPVNVYKFKNEITAGMSSINNSTSGAETHLPFGGNRKSGNGGRLSGIWVLDQFTRWHSVNWDMSGKLQLAQMDTDYVEPEMDYTIQT